MKEIYKLKEDILELYRVKGLPLIIVTRIIVALFSVVIINLNFGTHSGIISPLISILIALVAGVLPISLGTIVLMAYTINHVLAISMVAALIMGGILFISFVLSKLVAPEDNYLFVGAFLISLLGGTYAAPIMLALVGSPLGVLSVVGGVCWHTLLALMSDIKSGLNDESITETMSLVMESVIENKTILLSLIVIGVVYLIVAIIKTLPINESWKTAVGIGAMSSLILMIIGAIILSAKVPYLSLILGLALGCVLALIIEIFVHNVDYKKTEMLNFEDDEYIYFVKAIPKKDAPRKIEIQGNRNQNRNQERRQQMRREIAQQEAEKAEKVSQIDKGISPTKDSAKSKTEKTVVNKQEKSNTNSNGAKKKSSSSTTAKKTNANNRSNQNKNSQNKNGQNKNAQNKKGKSNKKKR